MKIEHTSRGLAIVRFTDVAGAKCSILDSSVANETTMRFGMNQDEHGEDGQLMHLTMRMAQKVARLFRDYISIGTRDLFATFDDRDGSECMFNQTAEGEVLLGITATQAHGSFVSLMVLDKEACKNLLPLLLAFIGGGTIASSTLYDLDAVETAPVLDVKIAKSMLNRADVGETGISVATLIDTFLTMLDGEDLDSLRSRYGHDRSNDINALYTTLRPLRSD